jgi:hypothetical protein
MNDTNEWKSVPQNFQPKEIETVEFHHKISSVEISTFQCKDKKAV